MTMMYTLHPFVGDCRVVFDWLKSALPRPKGTALAASAGQKNSKRSSGADRSHAV
jgi:hypothetical protein